MQQWLLSSTRTFWVDCFSRSEKCRLKRFVHCYMVSFVYFTGNALVPGANERMLRKVVGLSCDAAVLDLEDGVRCDSKQLARRLCQSFAIEIRKLNSCKLGLRVNHFRKGTRFAQELMP